MLGPVAVMKHLPSTVGYFTDPCVKNAPAPPPVDEKYLIHARMSGPLPGPIEVSDYSPTYVYRDYSIPSPAALCVVIVISRFRSRARVKQHEGLPSETVLVGYPNTMVLLISPFGAVQGALTIDTSLFLVLWVFYYSVVCETAVCSTSVILAPDMVSSDALEDALAISDRIGVLALFSATRQHVSWPSQIICSLLVSVILVA